MKSKNRIQTIVATGRFTLPVVAIIVLFIWMISMGPWTEALSIMLFAAAGYLLIELNTTFSLIRTRTTMHVSLYWIATSVCLFLHPFRATSFVPLLFIISLFYFLRSYESQKPAFNITSTFFFLSVASILFPCILFFIPFIYLSMIGFRCLNLKSFFAGLIGLLTPYWFLFTYSFWNDELSLFYAPFKKVMELAPFNFERVEQNEIVTAIIILALSLIYTIHYLGVSYLDKTRTRMSFFLFIFIEIWNLIIWLLQPANIVGLLQIQILCFALLGGHFFALTRNKFSNIFFIITTVCIIFLAIYNIWMQFFNFL